MRLGNRVSFLLSLLLLSLAMSSSFVKVPVYWKSANASNSVFREGRRLHDYLYLTPTYGDSKGLGYFYTLVYVGNPPQRQTVILDTGSSILSFPCSTCTSCGQHQNAPFNPRLSRTIRPVGCNEQTYKGKCNSCQNNQCYFSQSYLEGSSMSGPLYWDTIWLGGNVETEEHIPAKSHASFSRYGLQHEFGCSHSMHGLFQRQLADGIIGLAPREMSYIGRFQSQLKTLREANPKNSIQEAFSFCFVEGGGYMILGGYDSENNLSPMCFTPFSSLNRYYRVAFSAVSFDAQRAYYLIDKWNANAGVMIDSGTTFTYLISSEYRVFTQAFVEALRQSLNKAHATLPPVKRFREHHCYRVTSPEEVALFPTLRITLSSGCPFVVDPHHYMYEVESHVWCMGVYSDPTTVIGNNILQDQNAVFDLKNKQWGIAKANCAGKKAIQTQDHADITKPFTRVTAPVKKQQPLVILNTASSKVNPTPKMSLRTQQPSQSPPVPSLLSSQQDSKPSPTQQDSKPTTPIHMMQSETQAPAPVVQKEKEELEAVQYVQYMQQLLYLRGKGELDEVLSHWRIVNAGMVVLCVYCLVVVLRKCR
ncbi:hypothetical protein WA556_002019, partial [Blastocystis sp. ATCC 50177/Nand II]